MTVIAYRDRVLAGDSCAATSGTIVSLATKVCRLPSGVLYGAAGDADDRPLLLLLDRVKTPADLPTLDQLAELKCAAYALLVFPDAQVWSISSGAKAAEAFRIKSPFAAVGCGADLALGAMEAGASAKRACTIACRRNTYCRPPITAVRLRRK